MHPVLFIESAAAGVLLINGVFCGPLEEGGQSFPAGRDAEVYIQLFPFGEKTPLTAWMRLSGGEIETLKPAQSVYALRWPDGVIQLELRTQDAPQADQQNTQTAATALLRYLTMRLAGDPQAERLLLRAQDAPDLLGYEAVVPLRFAPLSTGERYDERAGLVRRTAENTAVVDAALAMTVPAGQGQRRIERIDIVRT